MPIPKTPDDEFFVDENDNDNTGTGATGHVSNENNSDDKNDDNVHLTTQENSRHNFKNPKDYNNNNDNDNDNSNNDGSNDSKNYDFDITEGRRLVLPDLPLTTSKNFNQLNINVRNEMNQVDRLVEKVMEQEHVARYLYNERIRTNKSDEDVRNEFRGKVKRILMRNAGVMTYDFDSDEDAMDNFSSTILDLIIQKKYDKRINLYGVVNKNYLIKIENKINATNERLKKEIDENNEQCLRSLKEYDTLCRKLNGQLSRKIFKQIVKRRLHLKTEMDELKAKIERKKNEARLEKINILNDVKRRVAKNDNSSDFAVEVVGLIDRDLEDEDGFQNSTKRTNDFSKIQSMFKNSRIAEEYSKGEIFNSMYFTNILYNLIPSSVGTTENSCFRVAQNTTASLAEHGCFSKNGTIQTERAMAYLPNIFDLKSMEKLKTAIKTYNRGMEDEIKKSKVYDENKRQFAKELELLNLKTQQQEHYEVDLSKFGIKDGYELEEWIDDMKSEKINKYCFSLNKKIREEKKEENETFKNNVKLIKPRVRRGEILHDRNGYLFVMKNGKLFLVNGCEKKEEKGTGSEAEQPNNNPIIIGTSDLGSGKSNNGSAILSTNNAGEPGYHVKKLTNNRGIPANRIPKLRAGLDPTESTGENDWKKHKNESSFLIDV